MKLRIALLYGILGLSLSGALGAAVYAFPAQDRAGGALPQDEEKLLQYAQERMNQGDWIQADKAFKSWLEKFPDGKQAEHVHSQLANLHQWYSRKPAEARGWLTRACEKWPKSPNYWNWRFQIAQSWANQSLRDQAVAEYRKIAKEAPDAHVRANALQSAWSVQGKYFRLYVNQTFTAGQEPVVHANLSKIDKVAFRATHIKWEALLDVLGGKDRRNLRDSIDKLGKGARTVLKEWTADYAYEKNRWKNETIKIPSTAPGVYLLEGEHEGVTMTVTLFVSRNGLVTKAAAGKLLAFVQDRSTSKPVEGAEIRVLHGEQAVAGRTDAQGVYVLDGFKGGTVIAVHEGDVATTESHWNGDSGEEALFHVTTDRPIYRPNQTVFFRVVHRTEKGEKLFLADGETRVVEIRDAKGNKIYEKTHAFNAFGSTEGEIVLGDEPPLGEYKIFLRGEKDDPDTYRHSWRWYGQWGQGPRNFGKFRVDEYRKPEYKVDVEFKKSPVLQGEKIEAEILAKYYFGSPVVDAEVKYSVHRRGHWSYWRCWDFYYDWYAEDEDDEIYGGKPGRRGGWGHGEQVLQGTARTGKDGKVQVAFDAAKWDHDAVYTVVAHVTDLSRRTVDGAGSVKATRAEFGLAMTLNKYVYKPGESINAKVRAATPDDRVVPQVRVVVKAYDRRWKDGRHEDEFLFQGTSTTDANGVAEFDLAPRREGGYLWIVAEAEDARGNKVETQHWAWLCGAGWSGDTVNLNGVDLVLDKKTYEVGDTAKALVTSQFRNVSLLFTVEGKEIFHHEVVAVKGHTKLIEFKIDKGAYAPNVFLEVIAIKENAVVQKRKMIVVNPSARFVKVDIAPDRSQYRPRNKAVYTLTTTGADGRPVAAEVSLGVVDESIYALQDEYAWDIRKHFIHRRGNEVGTTTSLQYWDYGRADEKSEADGLRAKPAAAPAPEAAAQKAGEERARGDRNALGEGGAGGVAPTEVRSKFADTMIWKTVRTGPDGRATVEVDVPDNLTTWRATARAATVDSRFGQSNNDVVVRKDMIVRLEAPRFFTQNDEVIFSAIAHNYMPEAKDVRIEMTAAGLDVTGAAERIVRVDSQGQARIDWKAKVRTAGAAVLTVKALATGDSDAMQLTVPVLPHGAMRWESKGGVAEGKVVEKVTIPDGPAREAAELVVVLSPTHAAMVLDALDYLAGYPYGCVEQTMSRFLPTVVVSQALQKLGIEKKELQAELPAMVSTGLQRLYNFQQQDGGWGWWQNDKSNPWTTAYVVMGLAMAKNADHYVEPHVLARGMQALQKHLAAAGDADLQSYCLYALSVAGLKQDVVRDRLTDKLSELRPYSKALLALVLAKDGRDAKEVVAVLAKEAMTVGGAAHFEGQAERGGWMDHSMEVTAACLRAFLAVEPKHELVPRMVHWLSTVRQGNYWGSTKQTAMVVFSLVEVLAFSGDLNPDMSLSLTVNGKRVLAERVTKDNWHVFEGMRKFKGADLRPGENEIVIEKQGNGTPIWSIYAKTYAEGEDLPASQGGIQVERTYGKVLYDAGKRLVQKLESGAEVTSGDEIEVTVTVSADRDYEWLMLDCPMPSGFEAVREYWGHPGWGRWGYWYSRKEFRDEKVSVAMTTLGRGSHRVQYVMRAEAPGDVHVLPAAVFNMYHPQIGGNSSEFRLKVKDR